MNDLCTETIYLENDLIHGNYSYENSLLLSGIPQLYGRKTRYYSTRLYSFLFLVGFPRGPTCGPTRGPTYGTTRGQFRRPTYGRTHRPTNRTTHGPTHGPTRQAPYPPAPERTRPVPKDRFYWQVVGVYRQGHCSQRGSDAVRSVHFPVQGILPHAQL